MIQDVIEKKLATYLSVGSFAVTIFMLTSTTSDPVNVTKLFALGGVSIAALATALVFGYKTLILDFKHVLGLVVIFNCFLWLSTLSSRAPFAQNYFGTFGRNNGLLTYALFSVILISALLLNENGSFLKAIYGLLAAGMINVIYCAWVLVIGDFIPWNNPYGEILGLFGNPDFISAFLGMFIAASLALIVSGKTPTLLRIFLSLSSLVAFYEIYKSRAIQGLVVTALGVVIVGFYLVRSYAKSSLYSYLYIAITTIFGVTAILGTLQKGPLDFVYKRSVSFRGSYWRAAWDMGSTHPFTGIGLDTYGDWYRRARPPIALIDTPGIQVISNVAHNVLMDFFASGGYPLLISYLMVLILGIVSIAKVTFRRNEFDRVFVALTSVWICYQVQSVISINQIGLAIWGWLFTGLLIGYEKSTKVESLDAHEAKVKSGQSKKSKNQGALSTQLVAGVGFILGLIIALPPLLADSNWFHATKSRSLTKIEMALVDGPFNPSSSYRYAQAVSLFQNSNFPELAHKYALLAVKFNADYFEAWHQLYLLPQSTKTEKIEALSNMKRLDPKNPDVTSNQ